MNAVAAWLRAFGPLRIALLAIALLLVALAPAPDTRAVYGDWRMVSTVLAPVLTPIVLMVLLLDALMTRIFMSDQTGAERRRLRTILTVELLFVAGMVLYWLPYYLALGGP